MELADVSRITMTNDVFDDNERERWLANPTSARTRGSPPCCGSIP